MDGLQLSLDRIEQFANLLVCGLREVPVPQADGVERLGGYCADDLSASFSKSSQVSGAPIGTATTICAGCCWRKASTAARIVEPVARPSSSRMTVRPRTSGRGRTPR